LLQVVQQGLQFLGVQHRQLVGPFQANDKNAPLLPACGVVGERQVDVLLLHVLT
jgi:hypothetical protein